MLRYKYYAAVKKNFRDGPYYAHADIIRIPRKIIPIAKDYPQYAFMFGGYNTRRKALQVAMSQGYYINSPGQDDPCKIVLPVESKG